ncbi:MAG: helix-turn-helix domain-containing protein [Acidimicrobiia bacterium]|nr:helix-turn-helix domain-containing protein [Acidimicrobiia bacterium]
MQSITLDGYRLFSSNGKEVQVVDNSNPDGAAYPPVIDTAQAAELLRMNVQMVRKYVREGRLPAYQLPGSRVYRFIYSEVIDYIKSHPVHPDMARR